eukprot:1160856-Pelagomonas_calceolata.AAC.3
MGIWRVFGSTRLHNLLFLPYFSQSELRGVVVIRVSPCPPVRDFEHKGWARLIRGETLAFIESRRISMLCIESRMVAHTAQLPVNFWRFLD